MASFGKLTDYFNRRKSREELRVGRSSRRSGSYCCTVAEARADRSWLFSPDVLAGGRQLRWCALVFQWCNLTEVVMFARWLQADTFFMRVSLWKGSCKGPILAKSRTLPSIPQSPTVSRVHHSDLIDGSPPRRKNPSSTSSHSKACTLPPAGELWRLEDDMEGDDETEQGCTEARPRSQSPFSHFRARAAYLRKSMSADDHLDMDADYSSTAATANQLVAARES
ncbi:hypothetical protein FQA47_013438 [Oryzias melastigma]|uniref:Uncharacterized protein n=1 Tax=Oryzias melastigma TaxID=30732 RepID=A0A834FIE4_ORYME|nr:hypothetical protein FQA47_013438 [Oryzias melastigma]